MFRDATQILVLDLELTCWEPRSSKPDGERREIIQIGSCWLSPEALERSNKMSIIIKPEASSVSDFCTGLTGITRKQAHRGMPYHDACRNLERKAGSRRLAWASWGRDDWALIKECARKNCEYPLSDEHINVSALATLFLGLPMHTNLRKAMDMLGLEWEGREHDAADDAWNTAAILGEIIRRCRDDRALETK